MAKKTGAPLKNPVFDTRPPKRIPEDWDEIPLSSYSPGPIKVKNPAVQTAPPENNSPGSYPSKETFPDADKKRLH